MLSRGNFENRKTAAELEYAQAVSRLNSREDFLASELRDAHRKMSQEAAEFGERRVRQTRREG